jgi:molybdate transport system substrate-binding protein
VPDAILHVVSTVAMQGVLDRIAPTFKASTGYQLGMTYGPGGVALRHLQAGNPGDVIILGAETIDQLIARGLVLAGSQQTVAHSIIGVAVKRGAAKPKLATVEDFKAALKNAASIAYTDPCTGAASGVHFAGLLEQFGMLEAVNAKARLGDGGPVARYVASGEAEIAIQQICEHMLVDGVDVAGPLPRELQKVTVFTAAVLTRAAVPEVAGALIRLLVAPETRCILPDYGIEPAGLS